MKPISEKSFPSPKGPSFIETKLLKWQPMQNLVGFIFICTLIISCGKDHHSTLTKTAAIVDENANYYTPQTSQHLDDYTYMSRIDQFLDESAQTFTPSPFFRDLIKAVAWVESKWRHYVLINGKLQVVTGDNGQSYGIFQINAPYHGVYSTFSENVLYALELLYTGYRYNQNNDCASGSNQGSHQDKILRRVYAHYNGGRSNRCRHNNRKDESFVEVFHSKPWKYYLN